MPDMGGAASVFKSASAPTSPVAGDLWSDLANNILYRRNDTNTAWIALNSSISATVPTENVTVKYSQTIGDYSQPSSATASSETTIATSNWYTEGVGNDFTASASTTDGSITDEANAWDNDETTFAFTNSEHSGQPQDDATYKGDFGTSDTLANRPLTAKVNCTRTSGSQPNTSTAWKLQVSSDDISYTTVDSIGGPVTSGTTKIFDSTVYGNQSLSYRYFKVFTASESWHKASVYWINGKTTTPNTPTNVNYPASQAVDDNTSTRWQSDNETNPWCYVDMTSSGNTSQLAIYPSDQSTATQIKIQTSNDAATWTDVRTIQYSNLTNGAWNYIRFNTNDVRYVRIYGNDGSAKVLAIDEIKIETQTTNEMADLHGHLSISATDTNIGLDGT